VIAIASQDLAYWYLRLNGFLTIPNFVVHPLRGRRQATDVDLLAVRFPHRAELGEMEDEELFARDRRRLFVALAEVKTGVCRLNDSWTDARRENIQKILWAIGVFAQSEVEVVRRRYIAAASTPTTLAVSSFSVWVQGGTLGLSLATQTCLRYSGRTCCRSFTAALTGSVFRSSRMGNGIIRGKLCGKVSSRPARRRHSSAACALFL
jgi:hypothetical protein